MIFYWILQGVVVVLNKLFSYLPQATSLPFGADGYLQTAVGAWNGFLTVFWPLVLPWELTLFALGILLTLMILRLLRIIR